METVWPVSETREAFLPESMAECCKKQRQRYSHTQKKEEEGERKGGLKDFICGQKAHTWRTEVRVKRKTRKERKP